MNVSLGPALIDDMIEHAKAAAPLEACGFLVGRGREATRFIPMENALASETAYEIDPAALASAFRSMRDAGEDLVAIFHSHPKGPAAPSKRDIEQAYYPQAAHIIVSLQDLDRPDVQGFRIIGGTAYPIELHAIV